MEQDLYQRLIDVLDQNKATYRLIDHAPEGRTELVSSMRGNEMKQAANCIIVMVKVGKKVTKYVLAVYPAHVKLDLTAVKGLFNGTYAAFASPEKAEELAGTVLGTVLPFSFSDALELIVDPSLMENDEIFFNAARLDRSVALKAGDYEKIAKPRFAPIAQVPGRQTEEKAVAKSAKKTSAAPDVDDLYRVRHSLAHVLAQAVLNLYPKTKISIGPPIDTGCYYDFLFEKPISDDDFPKIEEEMRTVIRQGQTFEAEALSTDDSVAFWKKNGQPFKVELVQDLKANGETEVTHYRNVDANGKETFIDLCRGGHVENLNMIPVDGFKIMTLAGAYWRGDETREQLTRLYVAAFRSKQELDTYLELVEEAKRRDHRVLGQQLDLFTFSEHVGSGLPMFLPKGEIIKHQLEEYVRGIKEKNGYKFVCIPHIAKKELYEKSGHMGKYDAMMPPMVDKEGSEFVIKPMNCPHHFELYNSRPHSYRDLPLRFAENTTCYRNEKRGELSGLTRVKALTQDDTHHFVRHDQIESEIRMILRIMKEIYETFGLSDFKVEVSTRDPLNKDKYFGDDAVWSQAEETLIKAVHEWGVEYSVEEGEAAFYGPKIDIRVKDAIGRDWQLTTVQLDFVQPENFDMTYAGEDGTPHRPAVLHVAILGSSHRFMGVIIEHFVGLFPLWLAPTQAALLPVAQAHEDHAQFVQSALREARIRCEYFDSSESLGKRIRNGEKAKIPYVLVIGDKEVAGRSVTVRNVKTKNQVEVSLDEFIRLATEEISSRALHYGIG